jgi:hypothetical protein
MTASVVGRVRCFLRRQRSRTAHRLTSRTAIGRQTNRVRLVFQVRPRQQARHQPTICLCRDHPTGGHDGSFDHPSRNGAHSRTFDGEARRGRAPDRTDGKIKPARCGAVGWRKSADTSGILHDVQLRTTACQFVQLIKHTAIRAPHFQRSRAQRTIRTCSAVRGNEAENFSTDLVCHSQVLGAATHGRPCKSAFGPFICQQTPGKAPKPCTMNKPPILEGAQWR